VTAREGFSIPDSRFRVVRRPDGSWRCDGEFAGRRVIEALPIDGATRCVILWDPDSSQDKVFENLLCVDERGRAIWKARLGSEADRFVAMQGENGEIWANTWSCYLVRLDPATGAVIERRFTK
jgi:outer membrane protein assembly factor BamB